jgi:hypothetical protein
MDNKKPKNEYDTAMICNIRRGQGIYSDFIYANIMSASGKVLMSATFETCVQTMEERISNPLDAE